MSAAAHIGSDLDGQRQRLAFSPKETTAARVLAEVTAVTEVVDLTLEEPAIEDIVRTLYGVGELRNEKAPQSMRLRGLSAVGDQATIELSSGMSSQATR